MQEITLTRAAARARLCGGDMLLTTSMLAAAILAPSLAHAQFAAAARPQDDAAIRAYWTPDRLAHAIPMDRHPTAVRPDGLPASLRPLTGAQLRRGAVRMPGNPGPDFVPDTAPTLYTPLQPAMVPGTAKPPSNSGSYYYTTTRVFPITSEPKYYPYRAAGHLFFTIQQSGGIDAPGNYQCTASVIQARIVLSAGHCSGSPIVSGGSGFFYYENWMFVPADINGEAPYGTWTWSYVYAGPGWQSGNGSVPNDEDWSMFIMADNNSKTLGSTVGWFGWETEALASNNITQLGYPTNLDSAKYMEQNQSQVEASGGSNTYVIGSAEGPGSSGGPWVMGFGTRPTCTGTGCPTGNNGFGVNVIVGANSYGPSGSIGYSGASELDGNFVTIWNNLCGMATGNC